MRAVVKSAGPKILDTDHLGIGEPALQRLTRDVGDLEADRFAGLALNHCGTLLHMPCCEDVAHPKADEVAAPELAVDGHVEQGKVALVA